MNSFILIGKKPVMIPNDQFVEWSNWFGIHPNSIRVSDIPPRKPLGKGEGATFRKLNRFRKQSIKLSTVFLGVNHNWFGGKPILFETMIFGGQRDGEKYRYETIDQAIKHHQQVYKTLVN